MASTEQAFKDIFKMNLQVNINFKEQFLRAATKPDNVKRMVLDIDKHMFGPSGSLAGSIKAQGREEAWKPLSRDYFHYKLEHLGEDAPGDKIPPKEIISTDIWIRTGKFLEFTQTRGSSRFKRIVIKPEALFKGERFYEVYVRKLDYWSYPNETRPIAFFTKEDKAVIGQIVKEWTEEMIVEGMRGDG